MSFLDILYPPRCLHCYERMTQHQRLCSTCLPHFTLLPKEGHCLKCGAGISLISGTCQTCRTHSHQLKRFGVCFDAFGPASSLVRSFLRTQHPDLAREIASLMVIQLETLDFGDLDLVTMIPNAIFNPQYAVGRLVAKNLGLPFFSAIRREIKPGINFVLKSHCNLIHKRLLLLDLTTTTRLPVQRAAQALSRGWPQTQHGLTFCATC